MVWQGTNPGNTEYEIYGKQVDAISSGSELSSQLTLSDMGPAGDHTYFAIDPAVAVDSSANRYLVVWSGSDNSGSLVSGEFEIWGQLVNGSSFTEVNSDFRISSTGTDGTTTQIAAEPDVTLDNGSGHFAVTWRADKAAEDDNEIYIETIDSTGTTQSSDDQLISSTSGSFGADRPIVVGATSIGTLLFSWHADSTADDLVDNELEIYATSSCLAADAVVPTLGISIASNEVQLQWVDNANNRGGYIIGHDLLFTGSFTETAQVNAGSTSYIYSGTAADIEKAHFYQVKGANGCSESSAASNTVVSVTYSLVPDD